MDEAGQRVIRPIPGNCEERECHDERTPKQQGSQKETRHDPERKEKCEENQAGDQALFGKRETGLTAKGKTGLTLTIQLLLDCEA